MDRYQNLDLDLECDGERGAQKPVLFRGMFKKSSKSGEKSVNVEESLSTDSDLSKSDASVTDSNDTKSKGGLLKGMFKKTTKHPKEDQPQANLLSQNSKLSASSDSLSSSSSKLANDNLSEPSELSSSHGSTDVFMQSQMDDKDLKDEESTEAREDGIKSTVKKKTAVSDDRRAKEQEQSSSKDEKKEEKTEKVKVMKPKKQNPFMPQVKAKLIQRSAQAEPAGNKAENEGGSRSLLEQLDDLHVEPTKPEDVDLMEWWNTVESWEDTPKGDDMTEKEEAKAFAVTADKVQKGIRVFNKLFSERAESLWQHVMDLNGIADGLDKFNKNTKIAQITGGSTSAIGGIATIAGLALAPFTMGTSLIVTAVGLGVATAGGLTSAGAGISNQVNNSMDRKKVEKIVEDYQEKILDLNKCLKFIQQGIENLRKFDLIKMKKHAYNQDFPVITSNLYEDGAMAGKAILSNANEIMRVVQIAHVAGSTAARAVQVASMATGVLTGLFIGMDIYFVAKDSKELKKGAKSEFAAKIREVATQLHDGLVELNGIRMELQSGSPRNEGENDKAALDRERQDDDDEIDRIKKAFKKDIENRAYV
ncbi:apolipoprotein L1 isoform X2 [Betta splendens]|uniref:Apolipoprotein L1 isoform X2 n=1 Tax=Betta splendens TaxID=158456 RepID=A0A6P7L2Q7_BETSP|nr:apolipoprotein L1 isoform X2 [Betta splendens]